MRALKINQLKAERKKFQKELEKLEKEISVLSGELEEIKRENLNILSRSIKPLQEVLRNNRQIENEAIGIISKSEKQTENEILKRKVIH